MTQGQYDALQREIIETEQKLKDLEKQAENSNVALQKIGQVGDKLQAVGDKVSGAGKNLTRSVTAPVVGLGTAAVATAANFVSSMSQVQATMGITKDSMSMVNGESVNTMDTLSALAKQMGSETAFSASECAEALNYLALADYDTQEMCDTLPTVLNLAAAGGIDLASASDMVTDAMSALGMGTDEATTMVDQMAKTSSTTNTSVAQLGDAILTIGATAKSVKGGTAELNTALGILANNGIKGAIGAVKGAVGNVASTIKSFLHFSVPDEGPLTDYESWMPDFMAGLAKGIEQSRGTVKAAIGNVADDLTLTPTITAATSGLEAIRNGGMTQSDNALTVVSSNSEMTARLDAMYEVVTKYLPRLANRQIVLDSGTLVGELSDGMNRTLGRNLL